MKRDLQFSSVFKHLMVLAIMLVTSTTAAVAGEDNYYSFYASLQTYPSGAGKVYAEASDEETITTDEATGMPFCDMSTPAEQVDVKYIYKGMSSMGFNAYAVPADGWILAGFSGCKKDAEGNHVFNDSIASLANPSNLWTTSYTKADDIASAITNMQLAPDTTYYALFTHIAAGVVEGQDSLGTAEISKVCNNIGDNITLTAKIRNAEHTQFDYWIKEETGEKITANPLNLAVSECAHYKAHFSSDLAETVNFPVEGGLKIFYSNHSVSVPSNVKILTFNYNNGEYGDSVRYNQEKDAFYQVPDTAMYSAYANEPYIVLGKGEATFFKTGEEINEYSVSYFKWSGESAVKVADLATTSHYYTINLEKQQFELLADDATIPANTAYWALPNDRYEVWNATAAPTVIYWNDPSTTGISTINKENPLKNVAKKGIYNIQGQKVEKMTGKGLYIIDGKKVINLAK